MVHSLSRRALMRGLTAGTVASAFGSHTLARQSTPSAAGSAGATDFDVIVVGAGVAGMSAGQTLRLHGVPAVVLEARDRIGGRCYCDNTFPAPFDFGGQFFHQVVPNAFGGTNNPLYDMYIAQGGPDVPVTLAPDFYENGVRLPDAEQQPFADMRIAVGAELSLAGAAAELGAPDTSAADVTADLAGLPWYTLTTAFLSLALDAPLDRLSALDFWNDFKFAVNLDGSTSDRGNPSGMGNFVEQFASDLDIRLSTMVSEIDLTGADRITVVTDQGPLTARVVIMTAPMTVLAAGDITFAPALPTEYSQAFADLPFGLVDKIGIAFTSDVFGDIPANTVVTRHEDVSTAEFGMGLAKFAGQPMMNLIVAEELAHDLEVGGDDAILAYAQEFLTATCGSKAAAAIDHTVLHPWGLDPLTMGSYSSARVGKVGARTTLATPIDDRLYFAGEAISTTAHSSLHGAYLTGQQAATSIAEHLGTS